MSDEESGASGEDGDGDRTTRPRETVLITGCSSGIGRATALSFREAGWHVYATARDVDDIRDLTEAGCEIDTLDVTEPEDVADVVDRIATERGRLDCLVNNAGYGQVGPVEAVPTAVLEEQFEVNVYGPHRLIREALPHMREAESGTVINVSSVAGQLAIPGGGVYSGSKFALEAMSDALRFELRQYDVDVTIVQPGPVESRFADRSEEQLAALDRADVYPWFEDLFEDRRALDDAPGVAHPQTVAEAILESAETTNPPTRYPVGAIASLGLKLRYLPDRIRDVAFRFIRNLV